MGRRFDAVFFDVGYTLVWFCPRVEEITRQALAAAGLKATTEQILAAYHAMWERDDKDAGTACFPATQEYDQEKQLRSDRELLCLLGGDVEKMLPTYRARLGELYRTPGALRLYADVLPALDRLTGVGYRLGIVSNWSWNLRDRLRQVALHDRFEVVMGSAYAGCQKPNPAIFQQALGQMGVPAGRAVHVGDFYAADVVGARSVGMAAVLLDREGRAREPDCPSVHDLWGLLDWLDLL